MPIACSSAATACASRRRRKPSLLDRGNRLWRDHIRPAGAPPPRPTSFGTAGRLRSEQVADINRNARPTSSESALVLGIRKVRVHEQGDHLGFGNKLGQHLKSFAM